MHKIKILNPRTVICVICKKEFKDSQEHTCTDVEQFHPICPMCKGKKENRGMTSLQILGNVKKE